MLNMWKADFYRITKTKGFYIYWAAIIISFLVTIMGKQPGGVCFGDDLVGAEGAKLDILQLGRSFTFYYLFLLPVFGFVMSDFGEKTLKNTISSAVSKKKYFASKFIMTEAYLLVTFVLSNIGFYVVNRLVNGSDYSSDFVTFMTRLAYLLPVMLAVGAAFIAFAFLIQKVAVFNAFTLVTPLLYTTVALVIYQTGAKSFAEKYLLKYELSSGLNSLAVVAEKAYIRECAVIGVCVILVSIVIGYLSFTKKEIA